MRALVSGGAGFIGSHLCEFLLSKGWEVLCVDNLLTGNTENISELIKNPKFKFMKQDVTESFEVDMKLDVVFHFASPASPVDYMKYPLQTLRTGSIGTEMLLEISRKNNSTFVLASTSEVYGDPLVNPQPETYHGNVNPVGPRGVYDEAKRFSETMTSCYHKVYNLSIRILRIFNTYGPRMRRDDGRVIPNFITQALKGEPLTIYGDGHQTRSFCYIDDLIDGCLKALDVEFSEPINLGSPEEITIIELAKLIKKLTKSKSKFIYKPLPEDDPNRRCPNITKAKKLLNWKTNVSLEEGLRRTIEWFMQNEKRNKSDR